MSSHEKTRALLEAVADEMNTTEMSAVSRYKMTGWVAKLRAIASSLEGQACEHDWAVGYGRPPYCNKCGVAQAKDKPA